MIEREARVRMQSEYETMVMMGHPTEFALERISSGWGLSVDTLRQIVNQYSPGATCQAAGHVKSAHAHMKKQAEIDRKREERQHKPDPRLSKLPR